MDNFLFNQLEKWQILRAIKNFLRIAFLVIISQQYTEADRPVSSSACAYPHFSDRRMCGIHDTSLLNGWMCDPDNTMSMSEVYVIHDTLRRVYAQNDQNCQCALSKKKPCWYKFAFAFIRELIPTLDGLKPQSGYQCSNETKIEDQKNYENIKKMNAETAFLYAQNYVRVLREKWDIGDCGEDILILVVQVPPEALISKQPFKSASHRYPLPMIFMSYGSHVVERFDLVDTYTLPYALEPLRRIVDEENSNLRNLYPLNKVLNNLVLRTVDALQKVENVFHNSTHPKHHIPLWAWIIFGACGVTFVLMAIGTTTRRVVQRGKSNNMDPGRRWKAGFVGEDGAPTTYVNLVNLLMPHPRGQSNNVQQQV